MSDQLRCVDCSGFCSDENATRDTLPQFCPLVEKRDLLAKAQKRYSAEQVASLYRETALVEKESYIDLDGRNVPIRPRIKELIVLAHGLEFKQIGMAFCAGLTDEAQRTAEILEDNCLTVHSVRCKCGSIDKKRLGVAESHKIGPPGEFEAACNPVGQAYLLNEVPTEMNIIVGLCLGHDMIFAMESEAPVTTFIVKDRYTGHNPAVSLYNRYHRKAFLDRRT